MNNPSALVSDAYFPRAEQVAVDAGVNPWVRYNIFLRKPGILCGMRHVQDTITWINAEARTVTALNNRIRLYGLKDGDAYDDKEPVALIEGRFQDLVAVETGLLGFLTLSGPATGMHKLVQAADGVPIIDMSTRHYFAERSYNEALVYAAYIGGAAGTSSPEGWLAVRALYDEEAQADVLRRPTWGFMQKFVVGPNLAQCYCRWMQTAAARPAQMPRPFHLVGTIPHALNAVLGGSIVSAEAFRKSFPEEKLTVLVDYEGRELDVVREAVEKFGKDLYAVRLDTHGDRVHQGGSVQLGDYAQKRYSGQPVKMPVASQWIIGKGVTLEAYQDVRTLLDILDAQHVKIVLSSGFDAEKTAAFRPFIDPERTVIGSGSWVGPMNYHPTGDIVEINESENREGPWRPYLKVGREYIPNKRLQLLAGPA